MVNKFLHILAIIEFTLFSPTKDVVFPSSFSLSLFPNCCEIRIDTELVLAQRYVNNIESVIQYRTYNNSTTDWFYLHIISILVFEHVNESLRY